MNKQTNNDFFDKASLEAKVELTCAILVLAGAMCFGALKGAEYIQKKFTPQETTVHYFREYQQDSLYPSK